MQLTEEDDRASGRENEIERNREKTRKNDGMNVRASERASKDELRREFAGEEYESERNSKNEGGNKSSGEKVSEDESEQQISVGKARKSEQENAIDDKGEDKKEETDANMRASNRDDGERGIDITRENGKERNDDNQGKNVRQGGKASEDEPGGEIGGTVYESADDKESEGDNVEDGEGAREGESGQQNTAEMEMRRTKFVRLRKSKQGRAWNRDYT